MTNIRTLKGLEYGKKLYELEGKYGRFSRPFETMTDAGRKQF